MSEFPMSEIIFKYSFRLFQNLYLYYNTTGNGMLFTFVPTCVSDILNIFIVFGDSLS